MYRVDFIVYIDDTEVDGEKDAIELARHLVAECEAKVVVEIEDDE